MKKRKSIYFVEKKLDNEELHYRFFIGCIIAFVVNYYFFEDDVIGDSTNYTIFVFLLPTVIGFFLSAKYFLFKGVWLEAYPEILKEKKTKRVLYVIIFLVINFLYAYIVFGMPTHIIWSYVNRKVAEKNPIEYYSSDVISFNKRTGKGSRNSVSINFKEKHDFVHVSRDYINQFSKENTKEYKMNFSVRRGLWNEYVVVDYNVVRKKEN